VRDGIEAMGRLPRGDRRHPDVVFQIATRTWTPSPRGPGPLRVRDAVRALELDNLPAR
jgi:hypothetical protein